MADNYDKAETLYEKGLYLQAEGFFDEAITVFQEAIECDPEYEDAYFARGCVLMEDERFEEAKGIFTELEEFDPGFPMVASFHGHTCLELGEFEEGSKDFGRALEKNAQDHFAMFGMARLAEANEEYEAALRHIAAAIDLESKDAEYFKLQCRVLTELGHWTRAVIAMCSALNLAGISG